MRPACWAASILVLLATVTSADDPVEFRLKDGRIVVGDIAGFAKGVYSVRTAEGLALVPERDIRTLAPAATAAGGAPTAPPPEEPASILPLDTSDEAAAALAQGTAALDAGRVEEARPLLERAKALDGWSLPARLALARACEAAGDVDAAEGELRQALVVDPRCARALAALQGLLERTGQRGKLDLLVLDLLRTRYDGPEADYRAARHFLGRGDLARAASCWTRYRAERPDPAPAWDVEARIAMEAEALEAEGRTTQAVARWDDLIRHNPLERDGAARRILDLHERSIAALLASRDVVRACEEMEATAAIDPSLTASVRDRTKAAVVEELSGCLAQGDGARAREILSWLASKFPGVEAGAILSSAVESVSSRGDAPLEGLLGVGDLVASLSGPGWDEARERLIAALAARAEGPPERVASVAEALEAVDSGHGDDWRRRRGTALKAIGLSALAANDFAKAASHLRAAQGLLPADEETSRALEDAEFGRLRYELSGAPDDERKEASLTAFLQGVTDEVHGAWARKELDRIQACAEQRVRAARRQRERYLPLAAGTRWVYRWSDGRQDEMRVASVDDVPEGVRAEIAVSERDGAEGPSHSFAVVLGEREAWQERDGRREVWLQFPIVPGRSWESPSGRVTHRRTYVSTNETVDTKLGTFRGCLKVLYESIEPSGATLTSELFYAPEVGLVKVANPDGKGMEVVEFKGASGG